MLSREEAEGGERAGDCRVVGAGQDGGLGAAAALLGAAAALLGATAGEEADRRACGRGHLFGGTAVFEVALPFIGWNS
eukprot:13559127-Alexandrium_andersonii.AAC.1